MMDRLPSPLPAPLKEGQILTINQSSSDPDGLDGSYSYQWQSSSDGNQLAKYLTATSTYTITAFDIGNKIRAQISYTDAKGFKEKVTTDALLRSLFLSLLIM